MPCDNLKVVERKLETDKKPESIFEGAHVHPKKHFTFGKVKHKIYPTNNILNI